MWEKLPTSPLAKPSDLVTNIICTQLESFLVCQSSCWYFWGFYIWKASEFTPMSVSPPNIANRTCAFRSKPCVQGGPKAISLIFKWTVVCYRYSIPDETILKFMILLYTLSCSGNFLAKVITHRCSSWAYK